MTPDRRPLARMESCDERIGDGAMTTPSGYHVYCPICARVLGRFTVSTWGPEIARRRAGELAEAHQHPDAKVLQGDGMPEESAP